MAGLVTCGVPTHRDSGDESDPARASVALTPMSMFAATSREPVAPSIVRELRTNPEATVVTAELAESVADGAAPQADETLVAPARETWPELDEVHWVTIADATLAEISSRWGVRYASLCEYNPEFAPKPASKRSKRSTKSKADEGPTIPAGTRLLVFRKDPERPTRSIGAPNRGRLRSGIPLPEGPAWQLRPRRRRTFGTHKTITSLLTGLRAYGEHEPEGPPARIGELSTRRGGRIYPHRSHRTGRDVDIGYVLFPSDDRPATYRRTTRKNFDAARTWVLVKSLLDTGNVQAIYMSSRIQTRLYKEAKKHASEQELQALFQYPWHEGSAAATIHHQHGHKHHFHVRFRCEQWNRRCRARSRSSKKKRASKPKA